MDFYCTVLFKKEYERLIKKNSYNDLTSILCVLFSKTLYNEVVSIKGTILYPIKNLEFHKKRLFKPGEYRLYFVGDTLKSKIYCSYIHPKKGSFGIENVSLEHIKTIHLEAMQLRKGEHEEMYKINVIEGNKLNFELVTKEEILKDIEVTSKIKN